MRARVSVWTLAAVLLTFAARPVPAQPAAAAALHGTWTLVSVEENCRGGVGPCAYRTRAGCWCSTAPG